MTYLKACIAGLAAAVLAAAFWIVGVLFLPMWSAMLIARIKGEGGAAAAMVGSDSVLLVAIIGFVVGFLWTTRRAKRQHPPSAA